MPEEVVRRTKRISLDTRTSHATSSRGQDGSLAFPTQLGQEPLKIKTHTEGAIPRGAERSLLYEPCGHQRDCPGLGKSQRVRWKTLHERKSVENGGALSLGGRAGPLWRETRP